MSEHTVNKLVLAIGVAGAILWATLVKENQATREAVVEAAGLSRNSNAWAYRRCGSPEEVAAFLGELAPEQAASAKVFQDVRDGSLALVFKRDKP